MAGSAPASGRVPAGVRGGRPGVDPPTADPIPQGEPEGRGAAAPRPADPAESERWSPLSSITLK